MPRLPRPAKKIARDLLIQQFEERVPALLDAIARLALGRTNERWDTRQVSIDLTALRSAVELAIAMPAVAIDRRPKAERELEQAERELRNWRRRRTIARQKVAKYSAMVRYRKRGAAQ